MAHETERTGGEPAADSSQVAATPESRREVGRRNLNRQIAQRQKALLIGVGAIALVGGATFLFSSDNNKGSGTSGEAVTIDTGGLVNRNLSEREFVATYGNRADAQDREIKALKEGQVSRPELEQQLAALKTENAQMRTDGQHAIDAISAENAALKTQLDQASRAPAAPVMPPPAYGPGVTPGAGTLAPGANRQGGDGPPADAKVSLMSFETGGAGHKKPAGDTAASQLLLQDSPDYLPPNSYAPARVIVGVDASTGVASQTDPLPVVLRISAGCAKSCRGARCSTSMALPVPEMPFQQRRGWRLEEDQAAACDRCRLVEPEGPVGQGHRHVLAVDLLELGKGMDARDDRSSEIACGLEPFFQRWQPVQCSQFVDQEPDSEIRCALHGHQRVHRGVEPQGEQLRTDRHVDVARGQEQDRSRSGYASGPVPHREARAIVGQQLERLGIGVEHGPDRLRHGQDTPAR